MPLQKNKQIEELKLYISTLINTEQDMHSKLISSLSIAIGKTKEFEDSLKVLNQLYEVKIELLEKIYKRMAGI